MAQCSNGSMALYLWSKHYMGRKRRHRGIGCLSIRPHAPTGTGPAASVEYYSAVGTIHHSRHPPLISRCSTVKHCIPAWKMAKTSPRCRHRSRAFPIAAVVPPASLAVPRISPYQCNPFASSRSTGTDSVPITSLRCARLATSTPGCGWDWATPSSSSSSNSMTLPPR